MIDLPTLEQLASYNPRDVVDCPFGRMEAWKAAAMMTGSIAPLLQIYDSFRNDSAAHAGEIENREASTKALAVQLLNGMDDLTARVDAFEARYKADAEETQRRREFEAEPLSLPPDVVETDVPQEPAPAKAGDSGQPSGPTHVPGGELHTIAPSEPADREQELSEPPAAGRDAALPGDPSLPATGRDVAGVPLSYGRVPLSWVGCRPQDQAEFEAPNPPDDPASPSLVAQDRRPRNQGRPAGPRPPVAVEQE